MGDNTRVKKLARKLQAETGLRYTEALARVRLQGAPTGLEKNTMSNNQQDVRPFHMWLGKIPVPPGEEVMASATSPNVGFAQKLRFQFDDVAATAITVESITVGGAELLTGPTPISVLGEEHKLAHLILVSPGVVVTVRLRNHGKYGCSAGISVEGEDRTSEVLAKMAELFDEAAADGALVEGQFNGLGSIVLQPGERATLSDICNHNALVRRARFDAAPVDEPHPEGAAWALAQIQVTAVTLGGSPVNLGSRSMALGAANDLLAPDRIGFGARPVLVGQSMSVNLYNPSGRAIIVSGGFLCDAVSPYWEQQKHERMLIDAVIKSGPYAKLRAAKAQLGDPNPNSRLGRALAATKARREAEITEREALLPKAKAAVADLLAILATIEPRDGKRSIHDEGLGLNLSSGVGYSVLVLSGDLGGASEGAFAIYLNHDAGIDLPESWTTSLEAYPVDALRAVVHFHERMNEDPVSG